MADKGWDRWSMYLFGWTTGLALGGGVDYMTGEVPGFWSVIAFAAAALLAAVGVIVGDIRRANAQVESALTREAVERERDETSTEE